MGGLAQRLVRELGMPAVLAMTDRVTVSTARALTESFYGRLLEHGEPDLALVEANAGLAERHDVTVPVLFSRLGGRPLFTEAPDRGARPVGDRVRPRPACGAISGRMRRCCVPGSTPTRVGYAEPWQPAR